MIKQKSNTGSNGRSTAVGYARVSDREAGTYAKSIESQKHVINKYCDFKGLNLVDIFVDAGVSGGVPLDKRNGGRRLVEAAFLAKNVVVLRPDRLSREMADFSKWLKRWERKKVIVHVASLGGVSMSTETAEGRRFFKFHLFIADMERDLGIERMRQAHRVRREQGIAYGKVPYGYRSKRVDGEDRLVPDPIEMYTLKLMQQLREEGYAYNAIATKLNEAGAPARGKKWYAKSVSRILQREKP